MWWSRGASLPPLVTTGSQAPLNAGSMSDPNVRVLFGNDRVDDGIRSGGRLNVGTWFNPEQSWGIGASFIGLQNVASNYIASSPGSPLLARPFFDTSTKADNAEVIAQTGNVSGSVRARTTDSFIAGDVYMRNAMMFAPRRRFDFIYGYRYLQLSDSLDVFDHTLSTDPFNPFRPLGTTVDGHDQFRARNQFNGGQLGIMTERRAGIWSVSTMGKVSLGNMHETVVINGSNTVAVPAVGQFTSPGSLLAQPSNIGRYDQNVFAVVPEATINLGCQLTPRLRATFGYSIIYIDRVAQSGRQIDFAVDPTQFGTPTPGTAPTFRFQQNGFWLQGINFGLNYRF